MRQVVLDTETTGLDPRRGNRVIEIGCIELMERRRTGREYQVYLNPERELEQGAAEVTGLSQEFLRDKPLFRQVADDFLAFVDGAELVIHNAAFDMGFLNAELARLDGVEPLESRCSVLDTLALAREKFPGQKNSLDALCRRLQVENAHRRLHGALLDANLLTDVYLAMTAGQADLGFDVQDSTNESQVVIAAVAATSYTKVYRVSVEDNLVHAQSLQRIDKASKGQCLWLAAEKH